MTGAGLVLYAGLLQAVMVDAETLCLADASSERRDGLPGVAAETLVVDPDGQGRLRAVFRTLREELLVALPGYMAPDVYSRGADPEACAYFFVDEMERIIREWTATIYHHRPHDGLVEPRAPLAPGVESRDDRPPAPLTLARLPPDTRPPQGPD